MITKFTIQSRGSSTIWDINKLINNVKWETDLNFAAGSLTFDVINNPDDGFFPKNGDIVEFQWDEKKIFYGYIFKISGPKDHKLSVTAYDKLRYFKNQDSLVFPISTISQRFETVAKMAEVDFKVINDSDYKIAAEVEDGKSYFDMLKSSIDTTQKSTKQMFYLFANYDVVELRKAPFNDVGIVIGDNSLMTSFDFDRSIDDASNVVRIIKKNTAESQQTASTSTDTESSGDDPNTTSFTYTDSTGSTVAQWGKLQTTENAKDKANDAQMKQRADELLAEKNREKFTLKLDVLGNTDLIPGNSVNLKIDELTKSGFEINNAAILKATHDFSSDYKCSLEMKVNEPWLENSSSS